MSPSSEPYVCSADHAGWLSTPARRLITDPQRILAGLVSAGDTAADLGCGPGFFTLPLAEMAGDEGAVVAIDLQQEMLDKVAARAAKRGLLDRIRLHRCSADSLGLDADFAGRVDFALAFWMVHEVPHASAFLAEVAALLRPGGRLLLVEPKGHVGAAAWQRTIEAAGACGLEPDGAPRVAFSRAALLASRLSH
jgi:ubiquinone/menaquinone biosynthesis C-methylase UbiE